MKFIFVVALPEELNNLIEPNESIIFTGVGKVNAARTVTEYLNKNIKSETIIINIGSCGSINSKDKVANCYLIDTMRYFDVDLTCFGYALGQTAKGKESYQSNPDLSNQFNNLLLKNDILCKSADIASGDAFVSGKNQIKNFINTYPQTTLIDMESAAIGQVCEHYDIKYVSIKVVSDIVGSISNKIQYEKNLLEVSLKITKIIKLIKNSNI